MNSENQPSDIDVLNAILRTDLFAFVMRAFAHIHHGHELRDSAHLKLLCAWLMQVSEGRILRSIINMPPRSLKSFTTSSCWPAWILGHEPHEEIIVVTHDQGLARKLADDTRRIMEADWYQSVFPATRIRADFNVVNHFRTTEGGGRLAVSMETGITGKGAGTLILDDAINADDARYPTRRAKAAELFDTAFQSRLNNPRSSKIVQLAQRLHQDDLSGHMERKESYQSLVVPLIAEEDLEYRAGEYIWHRLEGHVLDPEVNTPEVVERLRRENSPFDFAAQYQQRPIPPDGQLVDIDWFPRCDQPSKRARNTIVSWDTAQSTGENSSYSACLVIKTDLENHFIVDAWRGRVEFSKLEEMAVAIREKYRPDAILIENAANGPPLISVLKDRGIKAVTIKTPNLSKEERLNSHIVKMRTGTVRLCENVAQIDALLTELQEFPHGRSDDWVDSLTQFLEWLPEYKGNPEPFNGSGYVLRERGGRIVDPLPRKPHPQRNPKAPRVRRPW